MISCSTAFRFKLIDERLADPNNHLTLAVLCDYAKVSKSGYYYWKDTEQKRDEREEKDKADFLLILEIYKKHGYKKGARQIYMGLLHLEKPVVMNIKKIRRLMHKFGLECPVRKANPYRKMMKATYENRVAPNLLDRRFNHYGPRTVFLTDITYIPLYDKSENKRFVYLSVMMDACTKEVMGYVVSSNLKENFVLETVRQVLKKHKVSLSSVCLVHSDQGVHYTSGEFRQLLKDNKITQSMSRKGNCWDNAPQESFFGHMKDDLNDKLGKCRSTSQIKDEIDKWMVYYNTERYQWGLAKLAPAEYYKFITTGIYPLKTEQAPEIPEWKDARELLKKRDKCAEQTTS